MSNGPKLTPKMLARVLHEARAEDLADETAAMTEAEKDAALAKMGKTREGLKASLAARRAKYEAETGQTAKKEPAKVIELPTWRTRIVPWAAVAAAVGALGSFGTGLASYARVAELAGTLATAAPPTTGTPTALPSPAERARDLRYDALRVLELGDYAQCISKLDEALRLDPKGEHDAALVSARRRAAQGIADKRSP